MAIDKNKLLNELGSVMNQLQNADCGCMGNVFSHPKGGYNCCNPGGNCMNPLPTCGGCRRGMCPGHGGGCGGEPHNMVAHQGMNDMGGMNGRGGMNNGMGNMGNMGGNTTGNNPLAAKMGLNPGQSGGPMAGPMMGGAMQGMGAQIMNMMATNPKQKGMDIAREMMLGGPEEAGNARSGGMGAGGMYNNMAEGVGGGNMTGGIPDHSLHGLEGNIKHGHMPGYMSANGVSHGPNLGGDMTVGNMAAMQGNPVGGQEQMLIDAPQSPHGQVGLTTTPLMPGHGQGMQNPTSGYMKTSHGNVVAGNAITASQMPGINPAYGQHQMGMQKFNEMFPGVMKNGADTGGLDFDPMAIALQMNPNNHKSAVMETMKKVMMGGSGAPNATQGNQQIAQGQPGQVLQQAAPNQIQGNINPGVQQVNQLGQLVPVQQMTGQIVPVQQLTGQTIPAQQIIGQPIPIQQVPGQSIPVQQVMGQPVPIQYQNALGDPIPAPPSNVVGQVVPTQQQLVYNVNPTGQPLQQQQVLVDPNTGAPLSQPGQGDQGLIPQQVQPQSLSPEIQQQQQQQQQQLIPTDGNTYYNTLGQEYTPVPHQIYQTEIPNYPQPLWPPCSPGVKPLVKSTVSKTALMGSRPIGSTPSRSQLQQVYNQYRGSQSLTDQRYIMRPPASNSVGRLPTNQYLTNPALAGRPNVLHQAGRPCTQMNIPEGRPITQMNTPNPASAGKPDVNQLTVPNPAALERTAGDTAANDVNANIPKQQIQAEPTGDTIAAPALLDKKFRNGLQDMKYTSYKSNPSWSFHGAPTPMFYNHRYRSLVK